MDARIKKLCILGVDQQHAIKLVHARLDTPARIKSATDQEILALPGIGEAALAKIREKFPQI